MPFNDFDTDCDCGDCVAARRSTTPSPPLIRNRVMARQCLCGMDETPFTPFVRDTRTGEYGCSECIQLCDCGCNRCQRYHYRIQGGGVRCAQSSWECMLCCARFRNETTHATVTIRGDDYMCCELCLSHCCPCAECENISHLPHGETTCYDCRDARVRNYSYKPKAKFLQLPNEKSPSLYMGVEVEVDRTELPNLHGDYIKKSGLNDRKEFYCKSDGSLACGFEIVSHPASYKWWMSEPLAFFAELTKFGYRSYNTDTCGMHVHVSRSFFTQLEVFKLLEFCAVNPRFILKMSRRKTATMMNQWANPMGDSKGNLERTKNGNDHDDRYKAVNLENEHTVEFRFFRGTLNTDSFKLNLAFVYTLCQYIKDIGLRPSYPSNYADWLRKHRGVIGNGKLATRLIEWVSGACLPDEVVEV